MQQKAGEEPGNEARKCIDFFVCMQQQFLWIGISKIFAEIIFLRIEVIWLAMADRASPERAIMQCEVRLMWSQPLQTECGTRY